MQSEGKNRERPYTVCTNAKYTYNLGVKRAKHRYESDSNVCTNLIETCKNSQNMAGSVSELSILMENMHIV